MRRADYLSLALEIGLDVKSAMLIEVSTVYRICEARAKARREAKRSG